MNKDSLKWFITIFIATFILSITFSYISTNALNNLSILPAIILLAGVILIGIIFDIIGVAITVGNEEEFHAKATKKAKMPCVNFCNMKMERGILTLFKREID